MSRRKIGLPAKWDTPDMRGFLEYAKEYYRRVWAIAKQISNIAVEDGTERRDFRNLAFQVMATPLVYLYESWCLMSMEDKKRYMSEEDRRKIEEIGKQAVKQLKE